MRWVSVRIINASPEKVFKTVADPEEFHRAIPDGVSVEYLTPTHGGVGTRFRATRRGRGKPQAFDQEITEYISRERVRMRNVTHGTAWDGTFALQPIGRGTQLTLTMDAATNSLPARLMNRIISPMLQKALEKDMDAVKAYCEQ